MNNYLAQSLIAQDVAAAFHRAAERAMRWSEDTSNDRLRSDLLTDAVFFQNKAAKEYFKAELYRNLGGAY